MEDERKILFRDFLNDKSVYNLNVGYWRRKLQKALEEKRISFEDKNQLIVNKDKYGKNFYDGNPIFSYINFDREKAIRIIQEDPEDINHYSDIKLIEAWIDKIPVGTKQVAELVVSLYLTHDTVKKCLDLVNKWMTGDINKNNIDRYIS